MSETREKIKEIFNEYTSVGDSDVSQTDGEILIREWAIEDLIADLESLIAEREKEVHASYNRRLKGIREHLNQPVWHTLEQINQYLDHELLNLEGGAE